MRTEDGVSQILMSHLFKNILNKSKPATQWVMSHFSRKYKSHCYTLADLHWHCHHSKGAYSFITSQVYWRQALLYRPRYDMTNEWHGIQLII